MYIFKLSEKVKFIELLFEFTLRYYVYRKRNILFLIIYLLIVCIYLKYPNQIFAHPLIGICLFGVYIIIKFLVIYIKTIKIYFCGNQFNKVNISIVKDGIRIMTPYNQSIKSWSNVLFVRKFKMNIFIQLVDYSTYVIPFKDFKSDDEALEFFKLIKTEIRKRYNKINTLFIRPPYLLGIICYIPLLGIFPSIGFIISGIYFYRNKWLILTGTIGILSTLIVYTVLFPQLWSKTEQENNRIELSKIILKTLVTKIEMYKVQNGHYPDNLIELYNTDSSIYIWDDLQKNENEIFNYELEENNYKLFSSGIDNKANTKDDIYPIINDSIKVRLIRK